MKSQQVFRTFAILIAGMLIAPAWGQGGQGGFGGGGMGGGRAGGSDTDGDRSTFTHILTPGDRGEWPLTVRDGETIVVRAVSSVFDPAIELVDSTGKLLAKNDDIRPGLQDALILHRFEKAGAYKVLVKAFKSVAGGQYRITFRRFVPDEAILGARIAGAMDKSGSRYFRFPVQAGQTMVITARASSFGPNLDVTGPNGESVGAGSTELGGGWARRLVFRASASGHYFARVYSNGSERGSFALTISAARVLPATLGAANAPARLEAGGLHLWAFDGAAGDLIRIDARAPGAGVSASLAVVPIAKEGEALAAETGAVALLPSDPKAGGEIVALLKRAGKYQIAVSQQLGLPTEYTVATARIARPWQDPASAAGELRRGNSDYWTLDGNKGQIVQIEAAAEQFDVSIALYNPQGEVHLANDDGGGSRNALMTTMLPEPGRYIVRVHSYGDGGSGPYRLSRKNDPVRPLSLGVRSEGRLGIGGTEIWTFQGKAGQTIVLSARSADFDISAQLFGPDALEIGSSEDGGEGTDSLISVRLPLDGTYTVWVHGSQGSGRYAVRWMDLDQ